MPEIIFITGANRGIGLGVTRHLLNAGHTVVASCRQPEEAVALREMEKASGERLILLRLDVIDEDSALEAVARIEDRVDRVDRVDVLFNNAGVSPGWNKGGLEELDLTKFLPTLETNIMWDRSSWPAPVYHCCGGPRRPVSSMSLQAPVPCPERPRECIWLMRSARRG